MCLIIVSCCWDDGGEERRVVEAGVEADGELGGEADGGGEVCLWTQWGRMGQMLG